MPQSIPFPRPRSASAMPQHGKTTNHAGGEQFASQARARLETIKTHFETAPRTGKLKGKTCIITGAGSLKGIGLARPSVPCVSLIPCTGEPPHLSLLAKVGTTPLRSRPISLSFVDPFSWPRSRRRTPLSVGFRAR